MAKSHRKPQKFLNLKLIEKFLRDYHKMPHKAKSAIMAAILVLLLIPLALIVPLNPPSRPPLELAPLEPIGDCFITGCANQFCLDTKIETPSTTCHNLPEFQCLTQAKCERQKSGRCGWTETPEYQQCLSKLNSNP